MYRSLKVKSAVLALAKLERRGPEVITPETHRASYIAPLSADEAVVASSSAVSDRTIAVQLVHAHAATDWRATWRTDIEGMRLAQVEAVGDRVLVLGGDPEMAMVALDRATGEEVWRTADRSDGARHGARWIDGPRLITTRHAAGVVHVDALDVASGAVLWSASVPRTRPIFGAMQLGPGRALISGDTTSVELCAATGTELRTLPFATLMSLKPGVVGTNDAHTLFLPYSPERALDPLVLGPRADFTWRARTGVGSDEGDVLLLDASDTLTRYDARTAEKRWTLPLPGASGPDTDDRRAPRLVAFSGAGPAGVSGLAIVDLEQGTIVRRETTGGARATVDAGVQILGEISDGWRRVTLLDEASGERSQVTRVWTARVLNGEGGSTAALRFGRFWLTGPRAALPDALDWAVFDPTSGAVLWANGEVEFNGSK